MNNHARSLVLLYLGVGAIAGVMSLFTLWLLEHPLKYGLYVLEILLVVALFLVVRVGSRLDIKFVYGKVNLDSLGGNASLLLNIAFISLSALFIGSVVGTLSLGSNIRLIGGLLLVSFLPGYALLNIADLSQRFSVLEKLVFSYLLSYSLTSLLVFIFAFLVRSSSWILVVCVVYLLLGLLSVVKSIGRIRRPSINMTRKHSLFATSADLVLFSVVFMFFLFSVGSFFPEFSLLPGTDISRHWMNSRAVVRSPELTFPARAKFWFHLFLASLYQLSTAELMEFQTVLMAFNFVPFLAFYIMAKKYLEGIDNRLPSISSIFYFLFSGLAWIYTVHLRLTTDMSQLELLRYAADKTYWGTMYAEGFWIRGHNPMFISFGMMFALIYLVRRTDLPRLKYIALFSFLFAACLLTHTSEAVFLSVFLGLYTLVGSKISRDAKKTLAPMFIGLVISGLIYSSLPLVFPVYLLSNTFSLSRLKMATLISIFIPLSFVAICYLLSKRLRFDFAFRKRIKRMSFPATVTLLFLFVLSIVVWLSVAEDFKMNYVSEVKSVPWFFYGVRLGINGVLAIVGLYYFLSNQQRYSELEPFLFLSVVGLLMGRVVSFINTNFFETGYWETRFVFFVAVGCAVLASLGFVKLLRFLGNGRGLQKQISSSQSTVLVSFLIASVVLWGISSTLLCVEFDKYEVENVITTEEFEALSFLSQTLEENPDSIVTTFTERSHSALSFSAPPRYGLLYFITDSRNPTLPIYMLSASGKEWTTVPYSMFNHSYLYVHNRDSAYLRRFKDSYLQDLLQNLPLIFQNSEARIYEASYHSHPLVDSNVALVIPFDRHESLKNSRYGYDVLAQGSYAYTMLDDLDHRIMDKGSLILSFDPPPIRYALSFNGIDDYVKIPNDPSLEINKTVSVEAWIRASSLSGTRYILDSYPGWGYGIYVNNGRIHYSTNHPTAGEYHDIAGSLLETETWYHAVVTFDGDVVRGYLNGDLDASEQCTHDDNTLDTPDNLEVFIGQSGVDDRYWNGIIDEVRIYNRSLSMGEIIDRYEDDKELRGGLVAKYSFDTGRGEIAQDEGPYANDGAIHGANWTPTSFLRLPEDYVKYIQSGGKLVVLNTNGHEFFSDFLFIRTNLTMSASKIVGEGNVLIPNVQVPITHPKGDAKVTSWYVGDYGKRTPLAVSKTVAEGKVIYVNVHPLISAMDDNETVRGAIYPVLGKLLRMSNVSLQEVTNWELSGESILVQAIFRGAEMEGNVSISSNSLMFSPRLRIPTLVVQTDVDRYVVSNVSSIMLGNYTKATVITNEAEVGDGSGLYAKITCEKEVKLKLTGGNPYLVARTDAERMELWLNSGAEISLPANMSFDIYVHTPVIKVDGWSSFDNIEAFGVSGIRRMTGGLNISGYTEFRVFYSDTYSLAGSFYIEGTPRYDTTTLEWNEWKTLPHAVIWTLLLLPIFVVIFSAGKHRRRIR